MRQVIFRQWLRPGRLLALTALATSLALIAQEAEPGAAEESGGMRAFGQMIPEGVVNRNVTIPSFKDGRPASLLTASSLTRLDDDRLSAEDVNVQIYGKEPAETLTVDLKSAVFHMADQILRSGERSKVSRVDFEMEGDSLVYDTAKSVGAMKGRVRTLIFDMDADSGKTEGNPISQ